MERDCFENIKVLDEQRTFKRLDMVGRREAGFCDRRVVDTLLGRS